MEIKENLITENCRNIDIIDKQQIENKTVITQTPILMYDSIGTIVTVCDPLKPLKSKEEIAMFTLSSLKSFNKKNEEILQKLIHELGLDEVANVVRSNLEKKGLPPVAVFFAMVDIMTEEYCKKIGDENQELRVDILSKTHKLADPRIFDYVNEYSQKNFSQDVSQLILTQDNAIMKEVYDQMLKDYDLEIITVPNSEFGDLRKNNPELYIQLTAYLNSTANNIGFYDDKKENISAASEIGMLTKLATGIKNNDPSIIEAEATQLVGQLFDEQNKNTRRI